MSCSSIDFDTESKPKLTRSAEVLQRCLPQVHPQSPSCRKSSWNRLSATSFTTCAPSWRAPRHVTRGTSLSSPIFITPSRPTTIPSTTRVAWIASGQGRSGNHTGLVCSHSSNNSGSVWRVPVLTSSLLNSSTGAPCLTSPHSQASRNSE